MKNDELKHIPDSSRVWIFASPQEINEGIRDEILDYIDVFLGRWKAHGIELKSHKLFVDGHFLIIAVDESFEKATGCSIDSLNHFIFEIEKKYKLDLTDRSKVYYRSKDGISSMAFLKIKELIHSAEIDEDTLIYNNSIAKGDELKNKWLLRAEESWLTKYFQKTPLK